MNAIILAAGKGTRLLPLTLSTPKPLLKVGGKTMLELAIKKVQDLGARQIAINICYLGDKIIEYLTGREWGVQIKISDERDQLLDTGGGILQASQLFDNEDDTLIYNSDVITNAPLSDLINYHMKFHSDATMWIQNRSSSRKLKFEKHHLKSRASEGMAFNGVHLLSPSGLKKLRNFSHSHLPAFPIMDFYLSSESNVRGYEIPGEYTWIDAGKPESLKKANECFN